MAITRTAITDDSGAGTDGTVLNNAWKTELYDQVDGIFTTAPLDISGASAGQIKFPAAQNASSNVNTLDDYEEGTWTPSIGGSATYTLQDGAYTKIGNKVFLEGHLTINVLGTGSNGIVSGIPFSPVKSSAGSIGYFTNAAANQVFMSCYARTTNNDIVFTGLAAAGATMAHPANFFGNGTDVYFRVDYHV